MNLSKRETEIIGLIAKGFSDKEIAIKLIISARTVQTHVKRIILKLEALNRPNAVARWLTSIDFNFKL